MGKTKGYSRKIPWFLGLAAGLYPLMYFFSRKPDILDSWEHYAFIASLFLLLPIVTFFVIQKLKVYKEPFTKSRVLSFFSLFYFLVFVQQITFAQHHKKLIALSFVIAVLVAYFLYKHLLKIAMLELLLAILTVPLLFNAIMVKSSYDTSWATQDDAIEDAVFKKKPNVYFLEPDGYANFSELKKPFYDVDNSLFEGFLAKEGFKSYPDFRSNYTSTLSSNASFFAMKHHYFNEDLRSDEVNNALDVIMYDNAVLRVFKNNGYKPYFISDTPYLLSTRPRTLYEKTNFDFWDVSFLDNGIGNYRADVVGAFKEFINEETVEPKFFFVQFIKPWHISGKSSGSHGKVVERERWIARLDEANVMLTEIITEIKRKDPEGLIVMMADHGGYVGYNFSDESRAKTTEPDKISTIFNSQLSIHWPNGETPNYDSELDSAVNVFRGLITYLSEDESYLNGLQDDSSYIMLREGIEEGIYAYVNDVGEIVCRAHPIDKE